MLMPSDRRSLLRRAAPFCAALLASFISAAPARAQAAPAVTGAALGVSSITWSWPLSAGATGYRVLLATATGTGIAAPGANVSGDLSTSTANSFTLTALSTNTIAGVMIEAFGAGFTVDSPTSTVLTLAAQPSGTMLLGTINNRVSLSWVTNGNPAGVTYNVNWTTSTGVGILFSTNPFVNVANGSATATIDALPGGMTISFDVQAVNSSGAAGGFDVIVTTSLPEIANQPVISSASFANGISSITWYWSASTGALAYQLFSASNGAVSPILPPTTLFYLQTGLATNTSYLNYVYAFSAPISTASAPLSLYTLAAPTTALTLLSLSTATPVGVTERLSWGANGNPNPGTSYNVLWWTNLTSTITLSTGTTSALVGSLTGGSTLYFTVQSVNGNGIAASFDSTFFAVIPSTSFAVTSQVLPAGFAGIASFVVPNSAGTGAGVVTVQIASGTFASDVTLAVSTPAASPPFPTVGGAVSDLPDPIHLTISALDAFGAAQQPLHPVIMSVVYAASNFSANGTTLVLARYDTGHGVWLPLATAKRGNSLQAATDHLSSFAVLSVAAATNLSSITVGPNPLRPTVNPGAVMTFRGLPAGCRVRIFTYVGEKLIDLIADGAGVAAWDGRNRVGGNVASGVYLALIEGAGTQKTLRVAVER
jgi:hypothetical protein